MKHLLTVLLAAALVLTAAFVFTACGDTETDPESTPEITEATDATEATDETTDTEAAETTAAETLEDGSVFPAALSEAAAYAIPDLSYTTWTVSGGMADGKEMEAEDVEKLLATVGGTLEFAFYEDGEIQLDRADGTYIGTYTPLLDGYALDIEFDKLAYYAVMTDVEGTAVIVLSPKSDSEIALYLTQMEVG